MGDRFYQQQKEYKPKKETCVGIENFTRQKSLADKPTKSQLCMLIKELSGIIGIESLTANDLTRMVNTLQPQCARVNMEMPTGRTKAPYISECLKMFPTVEQFDKLTVAALKGIIEKFQ